jgi:hypothetical protein
MVGEGSQRGLGLPSLWLACELRAISVLIARFGVTCPYNQLGIARSISRKRKLYAWNYLLPNCSLTLASLPSGALKRHRDLD